MSVKWIAFEAIQNTSKSCFIKYKTQDAVLFWIVLKCQSAGSYVSLYSGSLKQDQRLRIHKFTTRSVYLARLDSAYHFAVLRVMSYPHAFLTSTY